MLFALTVTVIGFLLLFDKMGILPGELWSYFWPLLIIAIGLSMMYNKMSHQHLFDDCCWGNDKKHSQRGKH